MITGLLCGFLFGFVLQRGRFCITGAFRDMYVTKNNKMFIALLIAITVQSVGFFLLNEIGVLNVAPAENFAPIAVLIGAFVFGIGIVLAGGCATGTWYRAGEGLIGSWVALIVYMLFSAMMRTGPLGELNSGLKNLATTEQKTIYETLGISPWILVVILSAVTLFLVYKQLSKPKVKLATMKPKKTGLAHILFEKRWNPFVTAVIIGLIATVAWPLSVATGREFGLGITGPSANIMQFLVTGDSKFINWGVFLVLGILIGSFVAAKGANEFRFRVPDVDTILKSAAGGILMGIGATWAGGCSIGNGMVETSFFSWQGWVSLPVMILGTWAAAYFTIVRRVK
ncbi:MAG: YeeE/YedE family protein [[Actinobacillus] rossii]|uniref:Inner membrane protein n=1 Tax=[Actinobacillus] rossii TaxID=123820 RepID=A0A380TP83_9PAST|nr:YeeE/YedE family protein [[Actinobacillus] rossii]MDD7425829.1 YeeE/YedE family protein [[Actinobacillus] rossii]MDY3124781.1 YeeE/YedE family protein [[Actinobacillus] rossii]MDY4506035.1 YeeE/YedE family protein [[Actinobacillus] rossii]SUT88377.1 inner membrane protein [[Actinobacillus] rossii]